MLHLTRHTGRILVLGDLHLDFWHASGLSPFGNIDLGELDALIVAGDLTNKPKVRWPWALEVLARFIDRDRIVIVPGNHDYYNFRLDGDARLSELAQSAGVHFAQKRHIAIGDLRLLLCTLWTDFECGGDYWANTQAARLQMNDYRYIRLASAAYRKIGPEDTRRVHVDHKAWLAAELSTHWPGPTAVITHHAPLPEAAGQDDGLSCCYASDLGDLILQHQPEFWFFGHTHKAFAAMRGRTEIRNVSIGYPDDGHMSQELVDRSIIRF
ncbi:metallophosphoesterase [Labrenzia sp. VG12]|uniref:metallophosphoesterase n=1 Tax=Labrenzia sp. VG12 TaxID=2021862 RepID=UPI000B8C210C|nr:metallophosphoesterase [Labrenzia sp. VG12]ASP35551.1 hypothetical protein CHH27_21835 [Labrenzia sp. VG12]